MYDIQSYIYKTKQKIHFKNQIMVNLQCTCNVYESSKRNHSQKSFRNTKILLQVIAEGHDRKQNKLMIWHFFGIK